MAPTLTQAPVQTTPVDQITQPIGTNPTPGTDSYQPPLVKPIGPPSVITQPIVITQPGYYVIDTDVHNTTAPIYIDIRTSNVTIEGNGHTIDGVDSDNSFGIRVLGNGTLTGITIQNITLRDFANGISLYDTTHSRIIWVNSSSNTYNGIMIIGGGDNYLGNNIIHQDDDGIYLAATDRTLVINNTVTENHRGSGIHLSQNCLDVNMTGNLLEGDDEGFEIEDAVNATIQHNRISSSTYFGLNLTTAKNLTVVDNYLDNRVNVNLPNDTVNVIWNLPASTGENIIGNNVTGGNYWGGLDGTGFSDIAADNNNDGFADTPYIIGGIGTDQLPLVRFTHVQIETNVTDARTNSEPVVQELDPITQGTTTLSFGLQKVYPIGSSFSR
ncbi:NosD domain-containing protein [Methanosphaerula palustris]|uniref:NosD domain-containing protein n=1 Tax=Methanosphaerula palustris TaxID=475088 RepID=UPI00064E6B03|nr:NosD domain-containing protein [Methanosphaerula palustris]